MESRTGLTPIPTVIIGSGNVASVMAPALESAGAIDVMAVYSPTQEHADALAGRLAHARGVSDIQNVPVDAALYLIAVKDDAISRIAADFTPNKAVWLHTSGGVSCSELSRLTDNYGVFYPLQTFSKNVAVELDTVPVFIEGVTPMSLEVARRLATSITNKVYEADGDTRCRLHAAAVFACNFTNHLWAVADDILRRETGTDLSVLYPLLEETMRKAMSMRPALGQTGPARRRDTGVIAKHMALLSEDEARLYNILSQHIMDYYERN